MPNRALTLCNKPGCTALVKSGYCADHEKDKPDTGFKTLDRTKTPEQKSFYGSNKWRKTSERKRKKDPLCARCFSRGKIHQGEMVHHNPDLQTLLSRGEDPCDDKYLFTLCNSCHLEDLRAKRK